MKGSNTASKFLLVLILSMDVQLSHQRHSAYEEYLRRYKAYKRMYYGQYRPHKVRGMCQVAPKWTPVNESRNPVHEKVVQGYVVVLYLINRRCKVCYHELKSLHLWADYYRKIKKKVAIIALNRRGNPFPKSTKSKFPYIDIYEEPRYANIFKQLTGRAGDLLIYDRCGRRQYFFRYPYSSLVQSFVRNGIRNVEYHSEALCGQCPKNWRQKITSPPKITTTRRAPTTTSMTTTMSTTRNVFTTSSTSTNSIVDETSRNDVTFLDKPLNKDVKTSENDVSSLVKDAKSSSNDGVDSSDNDVKSSRNDKFMVVTNLESAHLAERKLEKRVLLPAYTSLKELLKKVKSIPFLIHEIDGPYN